MPGRIALLIALLLSLHSCADPRYVAGDRSSLVGSGQSALIRTSFPVSGLKGWLSWEKVPSEESYGTFLLKIGRENRADGSPIPVEVEGTLEVVLWMPSMGHGSSPVKVERIDSGTYRASEVHFSMPGDWEIRLQRLAGGGLLEEAIITIRR